jgi:pimeloyl-ACP methyl ester carboxylesterase
MLMEKPTIEMLSVPGARLYTETRGSGPLLVFIVGANGDSEVFAEVAGALAARFTVVTYDRRGFVRSPLDRPVDDADRLVTDVEDAVRVIEHRAYGRAHVFGSSSGAIVGLALLARDPSRVGTLVAHEPPMVAVLPDGARWLAKFDEVHATYLASGVAVAMAEFAAAVGQPAPRQPPPGMQLPSNLAAMISRMAANQAFSLEHELPHYPRFMPDLDALHAASGQLVLVVGRESRGLVLEQPARLLAGSLHVPVAELPGGHVGYITHSRDFAIELGKLLAP